MILISIESLYANEIYRIYHPEQRRGKASQLPVPVPLVIKSSKARERPTMPRCPASYKYDLVNGWLSPLTPFIL